MTAPADTIVYDSLTVAYWQGQPEYDYNRELITPEFDLIAWLNLWLGKLLQKIFGSTFAEKYTETILVALFVVALLLIVWFIYKKRPELFMRSKRTLPYRVEEDTISSVCLFFFAYMIILFFSALIVSLDELDFTSAFTASLTCISNVGPGLGLVGPTCNFGFLSPLSKLVLSFTMLLGRLEIMPLLVLFFPSVWQKK